MKTEQTDSDGSLNILAICPFPPPVTGQAAAAKLFIDSLRQDGHEVNVVNLTKAELNSGSFSFERLIGIAKIILAILNQRKFADIVYFTPAESLLGNIKDLLIYLAVGQKISKTKVHLHGGAGLRQLYSRGPKLIRYLNKWFLKKIDCAIVLGPSQKDIFLGYVDSSRIRVVANFAADETFCAENSLGANNPGNVNLLFLSNMIKEKGYLDLLDAFQLLPARIKDRVSLDFAGAFAAKDEELTFKKRILELDNVKYHGVVTGPQKIKLLSKADVLCLPTYYPYEGQPLCILEAYAARNAVLTTIHSGIIDVFQHQVNGLRAEIKNPKSIASAIERFCLNQQELEDYKRHNHREARAFFTEQVHLQTLYNACGIDNK